MVPSQIYPLRLIDLQYTGALIASPSIFTITISIYAAE